MYTDLAIADFRHGGKPFTVASELSTRLHHASYVPLADGTHPVCALIREICTRGEDGNRQVAERIATLSRFFECDAPPPVEHAGSPNPGLVAYDQGQTPSLPRLFFGREPDCLWMVSGNFAPGSEKRTGSPEPPVSTQANVKTLHT